MDKFSLKNQIEKLYRDENTNFLNNIEVRYIINSIKKNINDYKVFKLYEESEKNIVYINNLDITLYEIKTNDKLSHKEILGSLFSHNLNEDTFGDIIVSDKYYIVVLNKIANYLENNFDKVGNKKVKLIRRELDEVSDYRINFIDISINVSSLRIDNIISKLIPTSRVMSNKYIKEKKVIVNYSILSNQNYSLKENDVFSIRGVGKFKYIGINKVNKNNKYNILIKKYQ